MKRSPDFLMREVAGRRVAVPVGKAVAQFAGMITLNPSGVYLWELLEQEQTLQTLVAAMLERYEIDSQTAQRDVERFLDTLRSAGALVE